MRQSNSEHVILTVDGQAVQKLSNYPIISQDIVDHDKINIEAVDDLADYDVDKSDLSDEIQVLLERVYP